MNKFTSLMLGTTAIGIAIVATPVMTQDKSGDKPANTQTTEDQQQGQGAGNATVQKNAEPGQSKKSQSSETQKSAKSKDDGKSSDQPDSGETEQSAEKSDSKEKSGKKASYSGKHKDKVKAYFRSNRVKIKPVNEVSFSISIGTPVPSGVTLYPLPGAIFVGLPVACEHRYFVYGNDIIVVDARTNRIVDVIPNAV